MTTVINGNGRPAKDSLDVLFERLATETLDRGFEGFGAFIITDPQDGRGDPIGEPGTVLFFGNFLTYSHVFNIETNDPELIERLSAAIRANMATDAYKDQPPHFDTRLLEIRQHRFSTTQWEIELFYDGRSLGRFGDKIVLNRGQYEGHRPQVWYDTARRILAEQHAKARAAERAAALKVEA